MSTYRSRARSLARSTSSSNARAPSKADVANSFGSTYAAARYFCTRASIAGADAQFRTAVAKSFAPIRDNLTRAASLCDVHDTVESARRRAALTVAVQAAAGADHDTVGAKAEADDDNNQVDGADKEATSADDYRYVTRRQQRQAYMAQVAYTPPQFDYKVNHYYSVLDSPYSRAPKSEYYGRWRRQAEHGGGDTGLSPRAAAIIAAHRRGHTGSSAGHGHGATGTSRRYGAAYASRATQRD